MVTQEKLGQEGRFQSFAIDIGCYAHLWKLQERFAEVDVSSPDAKEKMRSAPILEGDKLSSPFKHALANLKKVLLDSEVEG